jgi:hypothetical protein
MRKITVKVKVNDAMQRGYRYVLTEPMGRNFDPEFRPELTPKQMLALGVFCGKYMTDCRKEFPASWFANARLSSCRDCSLNYFGVDASQPLSVWRKNGWIHPDDPRGWLRTTELDRAFVSGNPNGRPVGSRTAFSHGFLKDLAEVWQEHGRDTMLHTAKTQPATFFEAPNECAIYLLRSSLRQTSCWVSAITGGTGPKITGPQHF